jgi:hypothetical protein
MKKKILLIDYTTHHPELVNSLCSLFSDHHVSLVVTSNFARKFGDGFRDPPAATLTMPRKQGQQEWFRQLAPLIEGQDIVIFTTAMKSPLLMKTLALPTNAKKVVFVHNTHYFTEKFPLTPNEYRNIVEPDSTRLKSIAHFTSRKTEYLKKNVKRLLQGTGFAKIASMTDAFCFGSEHLALYFTGLTGHTNVVTLPTIIQSGNLPQPAFDGTLKIAILGKVASDRRDYLGVITSLSTAQLDVSVEIDILGKCSDHHYGQLLQQAIADNRNPRLRVNFDPDSGFVPTERINDILRSTHLLLSPIKLDFSFQLYRERYGLTKISGADADCIAFNRPILLPRNYLCGKRIEAYVVGYDRNEDLATAINSVATASQLDRLYQRMASKPVHDINNAMRDEFLAQVG